MCQLLSTRRAENHVFLNTRDTHTHDNESTHSRKTQSQFFPRAWIGWRAVSVIIIALQIRVSSRFSRFSLPSTLTHFLKRVAELKRDLTTLRKILRSHIICVSYCCVSLYRCVFVICLFDETCTCTRYEKILNKTLRTAFNISVSSLNRRQLSNNLAGREKIWN